MKAVLRLFVPVAALAAGFAAMSLSGGCGSKTPAPGPATVRGRVTLNGQPVAGGLVVFTPDPQRGGRGKSARAETAPDGSFALQLDDSPHIPDGWYRVSLGPPPVVPDPLSAQGPAGVSREAGAPGPLRFGAPGSGREGTRLRVRRRSSDELTFRLACYESGPPATSPLAALFLPPEGWSS